jgi:hypothetical protein
MCYNYSNLESVIITCSYDSEYPIDRLTDPNPRLLVTNTRDNVLDQKICMFLALTPKFYIKISNSIKVIYII